MTDSSTKAPSFKGFQSSSATATRAKKANRKTNTKPERLLRQALWSIGLRYRLHAPELPGRPDVVFRTAKVAVFCDGDFWHGRDWRRRRAKLEGGANARYWVQKIQSNIARDKATNRALRRLGWTVLRFWETDIRRDPAGAAEAVRIALRTAAH